jgi:hypothetical protein
MRASNIGNELAKSATVKNIGFALRFYLVYDGDNCISSEILVMIFILRVCRPPHRIHEN